MRLQGNKFRIFKIITVAVAFLFTSAVTHASQQAAAYKTAKRYDMSGRLTGTISPDPDNAGSLAYAATRYKFDPTLGLLLRVEIGELSTWLNEDIKPENWDNYSSFEILVSKVYTYDSYGRKKTQALVGENGTTESLTQYSYDTQGHLLCETRRMNPNTFNSLPSSACSMGVEGAFGPDRITRYTYDSRDQVLTEVRAYGTPIVQSYMTNTWDGYNLKTVTDANGNETELRYDDYDRLERRVYPSETSPGSLNENDYNIYHYDANGNLNYERKRNASIFTYTYDNNNRMEQKNGPGTSLDVKYDYDLRGLTLSSLFVSNNQGVTNEFTAFGDLDNSTVNMLGQSRNLSYQYDKNSNRTRITHTDNKYFTYGFDGLNRVNSVSEYPSTSLLTVNYRENGHRQNIVRTGGATTTYNFNNANRLDSLEHNASGSTYDLTNSFDYNPAGQLTHLIRNNSQYAYNGNNNLTGSYTPNGLNQYTNINGQTINYDSNGNLISNGSQTFVYDDENHLVSVSGSSTASFVYDPVGRIFQVTINGTARQFLYDGDALVAEYTTGNNLVRRYVHGDRVDEPWVQYNDGNVGSSFRHYLLSDYQGSIIAHSDGSGVVTETLAYDSFGIPEITNIDRFGFTGQIWFEDLDLFHYKARMYSPTLGRFLQTDPIFYEDQMNVYAYVGNDPANKLDPTGMFQFDNCANEGAGKYTCGSSSSKESNEGKVARNEPDDNPIRIDPSLPTEQTQNRLDTYDQFDSVVLPGQRISIPLEGVGGDVNVNVSSEKTAKVAVEIVDDKNNTIYSSGIVSVKGTETFTHSGATNEDGSHVMKEGSMTIRVYNYSRRVKINASGHRKVRSIYDSMMAQK